MPNNPQPSSEDLARFMEQRGDIHKPWNLQILRLQKLKEAKNSMDPMEYIAKLQEAHSDLMRLGKFWREREAEVFEGAYVPSALIEPLPGSSDDR